MIDRIKGEIFLCWTTNSNYAGLNSKRKLRKAFQLLWGLKMMLTICRGFWGHAKGSNMLLPDSGTRVAVASIGWSSLFFNNSTASYIFIYRWRLSRFSFYNTLVSMWRRGDLQTNGMSRRIFKQATEGDKVYGEDCRMVAYLGKVSQYRLRVVNQGSSFLESWKQSQTKSSSSVCELVPSLTN